MSPSGNEASLTPNAPGLRRPETPLKVMDFGVLPPKSGLGKGGFGAKREEFGAKKGGLGARKGGFGAANGAEKGQFGESWENLGENGPQMGVGMGVTVALRLPMSDVPQMERLNRLINKQLSGRGGGGVFSFNPFSFFF